MKIAIFGDSITWGADDYVKGGWAERLKIYLMKQGRDQDVFNLGIPGDKTEDLLKRFDIEAQARQPQMIIFAIGANDSQYINDKDNPKIPIIQFEHNLKELLKPGNSQTKYYV